MAEVAEDGGPPLLLDRFLCDRHGAALGIPAIFTAPVEMASVWNLPIITRVREVLFLGFAYESERL